MTSLTGALRPCQAGSGYEGELGNHVLAGFYADHRLSIDADGTWVGTLLKRGLGRFVGPLVLDGVTYEAVALPVSYGMRRGWAITLHRVVT